MEFTREELFNAAFELMYSTFRSNTPDKWVDTFSIIRSTGVDVHINKILLTDVLEEMVQNDWARKHLNNVDKVDLSWHYEIRSRGINLIKEYGTYSRYLELKKDEEAQSKDEEKHIKALEKKLLELQVSNEEFKNSLKVQTKKIIDLEVELKELEIPLKKDFIPVSIGTAVIATLIVLILKYAITGQW